MNSLTTILQSSVLTITPQEPPPRVFNVFKKKIHLVNAENNTAHTSVKKPPKNKGDNIEKSNWHVSIYSEFIAKQGLTFFFLKPFSFKFRNIWLSLDVPIWKKKKKKKKKKVVTPIYREPNSYLKKSLSTKCISIFVSWKTGCKYFHFLPRDKLKETTTVKKL